MSRVVLFAAACASGFPSLVYSSGAGLLRGGRSGDSTVPEVDDPHSPLLVCAGRNVSLTLVDVGSKASAFSVPDDQCFHPVSRGESVDADVTEYAWVPNSRLSGEASQLAPHGVFIYKKKDGGFLFRPTVPSQYTVDPVLAYPKTAKMHFADFRKLGQLTSLDDIIAAGQGLQCTSSSLTITTCPFAPYMLYSYMAVPGGPVGYVLQPKDRSQDLFIAPYAFMEKLDG